jgi:hypothetical protein
MYIQMSKQNLKTITFSQTHLQLYYEGSSSIINEHFRHHWFPPLIIPTPRSWAPSYGDPNYFTTFAASTLIKLWKKYCIFKNILFVKMRFSNVIHYSTNVCWSSQGTIISKLSSLIHQITKNFDTYWFKINMMIHGVAVSTLTRTNLISLVSIYFEIFHFQASKSLLFFIYLKRCHIILFCKHMFKIFI